MRKVRKTGGRRPGRTDRESDGITPSKIDTKWRHSNLICITLKQSHVQNFSSLCQSMYEKSAENGRTDGHHHTIIRPVWRRAYKKSLCPVRQLCTFYFSSFSVYPVRQLYTLYFSCISICLVIQLCTLYFSCISICPVRQLFTLFCQLRSIAAHRDHFVRHLSVCPVVTLSW